MNTFLNIDEYISGFSDERKIILKDLYKIIKKHAPKETVEKISYNANVPLQRQLNSFCAV